MLTSNLVNFGMLTSKLVNLGMLTSNLVHLALGLFLRTGGHHGTPTVFCRIAYRGTSLTRKRTPPRTLP